MVESILRSCDIAADCRPDHQHAEAHDISEKVWERVYKRSATFEVAVRVEDGIPKLLPGSGSAHRRVGSAFNSKPRLVKISPSTCAGFAAKNLGEVLSCLFTMITDQMLKCS